MDADRPDEQPSFVRHERERPADFVADDLLCALDPVWWAREVVGIPLDPWQEAVLLSRHRYVCLCCSRQAGKTTVASLKAGHLALYTPNSKILIVTPSMRQTGNVFRAVEHAIWQTDRGESRVEDNKTSIVLRNGSSVTCVPASPDTIRGFSAINLLIEDEAAFVADPIYEACRPMVRVSRGQTMLMSTPNGQQGHFFRAAKGDADWDRHTVTADRCPRIPPEDVERDREEHGENFVRQEYGCEFLSANDAVFTSEQIDAAIDPSVEVLEL